MRLWIEDPKELSARLADAPPRVGMDTEFVRERTWWPKLALVQLAVGDDVLLADPLAPGIGDALAPLLADASVLKVMHSASEDLVALKRGCGVVPAPLFDTQVAAALTGIAAGMRTSRRPGLGGWAARKIGGTPAEGAQPALMALESDAPGPRFFAPSRFFGCGGTPAERRFPPALVDPDDQARMWAVAEQLAGESGGMSEPAAEGQSTRRNVK